MASLDIKSVTKSYGATGVIHGVDVPIKDGEFTVLVGPSGCGKSTLLRMIAGLETITGGEIAIDRRRVNDLEPKDRDIAMVFQNYALYPQMTVAQNMGFALELAGKSRAEIKAEVAKAAEILSLAPLLDRKPAQLSGGQRQRVAMGRAIVRHPKVFLFDEPLSNLDAKLRVHMRAEIKGLHQRLGATIVYVTHDQIEAMTMADKIVVLNAGRVEQIGSPLDLYDNPVNQFVAGFLGSPAMNFLPATVESPTQVRLTNGATVTIAANAAAKAGQAVTLGIRPEHLTVAQEGLEAEVKLVEPTGAETHLILSVAGTDVSVILKERQAVSSGARVKLAVDGARAHLFDAASGLRLTV